MAACVQETTSSQVVFVGNQLIL